MVTKLTRMEERRNLAMLKVRATNVIIILELSKMQKRDS